MHPPDRVTVPTCIGCGAMSRPGACELGCGEERKLELVDAYAHDLLEQALSACSARSAALRPIVTDLAQRTPEPGRWEAEYRSVQEAARAVLRSHPAPPASPLEHADVATTWWCPRCGGIDAPQPCLGICVWRPVEWVPAERYEEVRARASGAREREDELRALLRGIAAVTPRADRWERSWRLFSDRARVALGP